MFQRHKVVEQLHKQDIHIYIYIYAVYKRFTSDIKNSHNESGGMKKGIPFYKKQKESQVACYSRQTRL